jgi:hypothetical protein
LKIFLLAVSTPVNGGNHAYATSNAITTNIGMDGTLSFDVAPFKPGLFSFPQFEIE